MEISRCNAKEKESAAGESERKGTKRTTKQLVKKKRRNDESSIFISVGNTQHNIQLEEVRKKKHGGLSMQKPGGKQGAFREHTIIKSTK